MANQSKTMTMSCQQPQPFGSSPLGSVSPGGSSIIGAGGGGGGGVGVVLGPDGKLSSGYYGGSQHNLTGLTQPPRQKGRPRKRKPKDLEAMTANLGELISDGAFIRQSSAWSLDRICGFYDSDDPNL